MWCLLLCKLLEVSWPAPESVLRWPRIQLLVTGGLIVRSALRVQLRRYKCNRPGSTHNRIRCVIYTNSKFNWELLIICWFFQNLLSIFNLATIVHFFNRFLSKIIHFSHLFMITQMMMAEVLNAAIKLYFILASFDRGAIIKILGIFKFYGL